jgi:hypothetical protein
MLLNTAWERDVKGIAYQSVMREKQLKTLGCKPITMNQASCIKHQAYLES